jgi:hypothetical protein
MQGAIWACPTHGLIVHPKGQGEHYHEPNIGKL